MPLTIHTLLTALTTGAASFAFFFAYISFFEWVLHKYLMHSQLWTYPFHAHALVHHGLFRADQSYHPQEGVDKRKVTFAWWNGPGLYVLHTPLLFIGVYFFGWSVFWGGTAALLSYYFLYESLHWCMHVPADRWIERTRVFRWLNEHHYIHHRYAFTNLNVVFPLADWVLGSLVSVTTLNPADRERLLKGRGFSDASNAERPLTLSLSHEGRGDL
jgi:hypothetical protein